VPRSAIAPLGLTTEGGTKFKLKDWKCYPKKLQCRPTSSGAPYNGWLGNTHNRAVARLPIHGLSGVWRLEESPPGQLETSGVVWFLIHRYFLSTGFFITTSWAYRQGRSPKLEDWVHQQVVALKDSLHRAATSQCCLDLRRVCTQYRTLCQTGTTLLLGVHGLASD